MSKLNDQLASLLTHLLPKSEHARCGEGCGREDGLGKSVLVDGNTSPVHRRPNMISILWHPMAALECMIGFARDLQPEI